MQHEFIANAQREILESLPDGHIARFLPDVDFAFADDKFEWADPVWGRVDVDTWGVGEDVTYVPLFKELLVHPAIRRLIGIEQLTLPDRYSTMPNAERFSRWEHVTGSAEVTSQLVDKWNRNNPNHTVSAREKTLYMLRTMLSDVAHTFGSHLGDWIEGDESEEAHDWSLKEYLEITGITAIIENYGIDIDEACLTEVTTQDFVESKSPNLCIDRIDYGAREIHRTNPYFWDESRRFNIDDFDLVMDSNGTLQVVMPEPSRALLFAKSYELLPQEDWSEPMQRLQTYLYTRLVKLLLIAIAEGKVKTLVAHSEVPPFPDDGEWVPELCRHYRDILNYSEGIIEQAIYHANYRYDVSPEPKDELLTAIVTLDACMQQISQHVREYVIESRGNTIANFTQSVDEGEAEPNDRIEIRPDFYDMGSDGPIRSIAFSPTDEHLAEGHGKFYLKAQKQRSIDPTLAIYDDGPIRLSDIAPYIRSLAAYEDLHVNISYNDNGIGNTIACIDAIIAEKWPALGNRRRMPKKTMRDYQRVLTGIIACFDYSKYTQSGALEDEMREQDLASAR